MLLVITQLARTFAADAKAMVTHAIPLPPSAAPNVPADLRDRRMSRNIDRIGYRISGLLSPQDVGGGCDPVGAALLSLTPSLLILAASSGNTTAAAIALFLLFYVEADADVPSMLGLLIAVLGVPVLLLSTQGLIGIGLAAAINAAWHYWRSRIRDRQLLNQQDSVFAADSASHLAPIVADAEQARATQNESAQKDNTPVLVLGFALGILLKKGDIYAPDRHLPMGLSVRDLATHLLVTGRTGSGKSACVMRPVMHQWLTHLCGGALILDGKGSLPGEFSKAYPDRVQLIAPGKAKFNPIAGLTPEEVTIILVETMKSESEKNDFWTRSAEQSIRNAGLVLEAAGKAAPGDARFAWKLTSLANVIGNKHIQKDAIQAAKDLPEALQPGLLRAAIMDLEVEFAELAEETRTGIVKTAMSFIAPIVGHRDLFAWCDSVEGCQVEDVLQGAVYAVSTPASRYGNPGIAIQALAKARVYRAIKNRADVDWEAAGGSRVLVMMDEFQKLCGAAELNMLDIGRSLGLVAIAATQSVEAVEAAMGKADARAMLANFVNCVCFQSSQETHEFVANEKMGYGILRKEAEMRGIDYLKLGEVADTGYSGQAHFAPTQNIVAGEYTLSADHVISPEELGAAVTQRFRAAVYFERAGSPRRDIVQMQPGGVVA